MESPMSAACTLYMESFEPDPARHQGDTQSVMQPLIDLARGVADIEAHTGRGEPDVIT